MLVHRIASPKCSLLGGAVFPEPLKAFLQVLKAIPTAPAGFTYMLSLPFTAFQLHSKRFSGFSAADHDL
jgi:hypothetical protein